MVDPKAGKFINSLVKSLQMLCHGYMDFKDNIEIIGHIYLRIDNSQKFDYIVNEQVSRQGDDSTFFQSNSYHSQPPAKAVREKDRPASENIDDDAVTNHIRLDDAAVSGSRVQIDLSGPVPVTRHSELSPGRRFSTSSNASDADHHTSYGRDSHRHSFDEEAAKTLSPEDHPHNHSSLSSARDRDVCERPASSSSERTEINTIFQVKVAEKSRQHESDGLHEFDGTVIVKAEPDEGNHDCVMEEEGTQNQGREMQRIPSVASVLPPAHQSALVANSAHAGHAMFAATLGHSGMFDTSMPTQDSNLSAKTVRQGYVHEAFMQQILSAQQQTHLAHAGARFSVPAGMAVTGAAAASFGSMGLGVGLGPILPQYPMALHQLAQTYMHAVWRQGLYHHSSSSSSTSATVSLQAWNATPPTTPACNSLASKSTGSVGNDMTNARRTLTPAERMREYREKLKRNPEVYQRYKQMNALRSRLARMRRSQEQVRKDREKARLRNLRYRGRMPEEYDLVALSAAESSEVELSSSGSAPLPKDESQDFPSPNLIGTSEWEPPVSFAKPPC